MNLQKSEIKTALLQEYQQKTQSLGTSADDELFKLEGAVGALQLAARTLDKNREFHRKRHLDEEITQEQFDLIMQTMDRDIGALQSLLLTTQVEKQRKEGEVNAFKRVADLLAREATQEVTALTNMREALTSGAIQVEDVGRPVMSAAEDIQQRRDASALLKVASDALGAPETKRGKKGSRTSKDV